MLNLCNLMQQLDPRFNVFYLDGSVARKAACFKPRSRVINFKRVPSNSFKLMGRVCISLLRLHNVECPQNRLTGTA
jgi:prepilin-type processing-associated H-X9-DG protein